MNISNKTSTISSASCPLPSASSTNWSNEISLLLQKYPSWQNMLAETIEKPLFETGYCPFVIEIFDQYGLLAGRINKFGCYECRRNINQESQFIAWMFDGELAIFYLDEKILLNRMPMHEELTQ